MKRLLTITLILAAFLISAAVYSRLPERMPIHFDIHGTPDGYAAKSPFHVLVLPFVLLVSGSLFELIPRISPRGFRVDPGLRAYAIMQFATLGLLFVIHCLVLSSMLGTVVDLALILPELLGLVFAILGYAMRDVPRNFFIGIRTPWTLASEEVWRETHRVGGPVFMAAGLLMMALSPLVHGEAATIVILAGVPIATAIAVVIYSYIVWKRLDAAARHE